MIDDSVNLTEVSQIYNHKNQVTSLWGYYKMMELYIIGEEIEVSLSKVMKKNKEIMR